MIDSVSDIAGAAADLKKARRRKNISPDAQRLDRLPPHSPEAEQGVLGCVLLSPNECMGECIEKLKDDGQQVFYDLRHQTIYEALATMYDAREAVDIITLQQNSRTSSCSNRSAASLICRSFRIRCRARRTFPIIWKSCRKNFCCGG